VFEILLIESLGIAENGGSFFKWDSMLLIVLQGLAGVPGEHIYVYTLINVDNPPP
jgi:hypothetical protein